MTFANLAAPKNIFPRFAQQPQTPGLTIPSTTRFSSTQADSTSFKTALERSALFSSKDAFQARRSSPALYSSALRFGALTLAQNQLMQLFPSAMQGLPKDMALGKKNSVDNAAYTGGKKILIDGKLKPWKGSTETISSVVMLQPSGIETPLPVSVGELAWMGEKDALTALASAKKAYGNGHGKWPSMSLGQRITAMEKFVTEMKKQREVVAKLIMLEIGKNPKDAYAEFDRTVEYIEETLKIAQELVSEEQTITGGNGVLKKEALKPLGVTLCLGPANYPLNETFTTLIPSLLMGNPSICKLPKTGALCVTPLYEAFAKCFPKGAINFISGDGPTLVTPIMASGDIATLGFIGSEGAAKAVVSSHPKRHLLNEIYGLGAKNPAIVLPNTKIDDALVNEIVAGALSFNGQRCTALKVVFVPRQKADELARKLGDAVAALKVGMPYEKDSQVTPMPQASLGWFNTLLEDAVGKGAKIMNPGGGTSVGTLFKPAMLYPVTPEMKIYTQEQFGPLVPIVAYDSLDEAIDYVSSLDVGQQASVFGHDRKALQKAVLGLQNQVCRINLNTQCRRSPDDFAFVGRKASAKGILSLKEALLRLSLPNLLAVKDTPKDRSLLEKLSLSKGA